MTAALQQKQAELAQLFSRLGELDVIAGDLERERAQVRADVAQCRAALQVLAASAAPETPTRPMRVVPPPSPACSPRCLTCNEAHPDADVHHPDSHAETAR